MKNYNFSLLSILISAGILAAILYINNEIAEQNIQSGGKTKALFGIVEIYSFMHKYFLVIPGLLSLYIAIFAFRVKEQSWIAISSIILSLVAIFSVFVDIWKFMI